MPPWALPSPLVVPCESKNSQSKFTHQRRLHKGGNVMSSQDFLQLSFGAIVYAWLFRLAYREEVWPALPFPWKNFFIRLSGLVGLCWVILLPTLLTFDLLKYLTEGSLLGHPIGAFARVVRWVAESLVFKPAIIWLASLL